MKATLEFSIFTPVVLAALLAAGNICRAEVGLTISPSAVSNTYSGFVTLNITGLSGGDTVVVQKFLDANTNGIVDAGDLPVQQFSLTDGAAGMVIGGVTNINVPGDTDGAANGQIAATLSFRGGDFVQNLVGQYIFVLSSPTGGFSPVTNYFAVTNYPFGQQITGGAAVSNAVVILFPPPRGGTHGPGTPVAGSVADNSGHYTVQVPPGTYMPMAFRSNYVADYATSPVLTLGSRQTITTNLALAAATARISGQIVDASNPSIGLPAIFMPAMTQSGLIAVGFSDTNGDLTIPVSSGQWQIGSDDSGLIVHGYVGYQNGTNVPDGTTGFIGPFYKATALFYGSVKDNLGNPLAGIDVAAGDINDNVFQSDGYSDANGQYVVGVIGGLGAGDRWGVQIGNGGESGTPADYVYSQPQFNQSGGTNLAAGQAVKVNFTAILATNRITGNVQSGGTNLVGLSVNADANIGGVDYHAKGTTDTNGNYSMNVANGFWSVGVNCYGRSDSLDGILGPGNYECPNNQDVTIENTNGTANFTVFPSGSGQIYGYVTDPGDNPIVGVTVYASDGVGDDYSTATDGSGYYSFNVGNGNWDVSVDCGGLNSLGYQCVSDQNVSVSSGSVEQDFVAQPISAPVLSSPVWQTNRFSLWLAGAASQNYTVQMSTNLSSPNWITLYSTNNPATNAFLVTDPNATNQQRFYRVLVGQ
jgi:hypothetical protein